MEALGLVDLWCIIWDTGCKPIFRDLRKDECQGSACSVGTECSRSLAVKGREGLENLLGWTILKGGTFFSQHWDDLFICWQRASRKGSFW